MKQSEAAQKVAVAAAVAEAVAVEETGDGSCSKCWEVMITSTKGLTCVASALICV